MLLLLEAQEGNWDEIDLMVRTFQAATQALRYADVPVVSCPAGMTLGGGCEIVLHTDRVQAAAEAYIGLVEVGVGLIPAAGGTKEMLAQGGDGVPSPRDGFPAAGAAGLRNDRLRESIDQRRGRQTARAICGPSIGVTMNRERLIADAKASRSSASARATGSRWSGRRFRSGGEGVLAALKLGVHLAWRAGRHHRSRCGGRPGPGLDSGGRVAAASDDGQRTVPAGSRARSVSEAVRRAKTLERIQHTLKTGKPLRN